MGRVKNTLMRILRWLSARSWMYDERGQAIPEYQLLIGLLAVGCVASIARFGAGVESLFNAITGAI